MRPEAAAVAAGCSFASLPAITSITLIPSLILSLLFGFLSPYSVGVDLLWDACCCWQGGALLLGQLWGQTFHFRPLNESVLSAG